MKTLMSFILLVGCVAVSASEPSPKYKIGDCLMIVDLPSGETDSPHRVRIEKIQSNKYLYRWLLGKKWDSELSSNVGKFEILEKISKKVNDCPK